MIPIFNECLVPQSRFGDKYMMPSVATYEEYKRNIDPIPFEPSEVEKPRQEVNRQYDYI